MFLKRKKFVIFGAGVAAANHAHELSRKWCIPKAVFNPSGKCNIPGIPLTIKSTYDLASVLRDVDFAVIASPNETHVDYLKMCLTHNKPCLVEKPLCANSSDVDLIKKNWLQNSLSIFPGYNLKHQYNAIFIQEWITQNSFKPSRISCTWNRSQDTSNKRVDIFTDWGSHIINLIDFWFPHIDIIFSKRIDSCPVSNINNSLHIILTSTTEETEIEINLSWSADANQQTPLYVSMHNDNTAIYWAKNGDVEIRQNGVKRITKRLVGNEMHKQFLNQVNKFIDPILIESALRSEKRLFAIREKLSDSLL